MRASHRHIAWAGAVMSAAAIIVAAAGPALAVTVTPRSPAVTNFREALSGVAVKSASNAWAVGYYQRGSAQYTLTEHWNGSRWTLVPSPSPATGQSRLHGVAVRRSQAWAVGEACHGNACQTLAELWNGTKWKRVPSPNPDGTAGDDYLSGVAYSSRSRAWAVGFASAGGAGQALIERWNGSSWKVVPNPKLAGSALEAVSVVSRSNAWAVGDVSTGPGQSQTLVEHWNGSAWSRVPSPDPSTTLQSLDSVSAVSASDVWAAGYYNDAPQIQTLTMHWNGHSWAQVPSPDVGGAATYNVLEGVTASSSDAWAVGYYGTSGGYRTLTLRWNGSFWNYVASPNPGPFADYANAVAMTSTSGPWLVGDDSGHSGQVTLTEHWNGTKWRAVASPNK